MAAEISAASARWPARSGFGRLPASRTRWPLPRTIQRQLGPIDILVNNAGWDKVQVFLETDEALWDRLTSTSSFKGVAQLRQAFAPLMLFQSGSGKQNHLGRIRCGTGRRRQHDAVYSGCKGGVIAFTKTLARELARYQITVNAVSPGVIDTPLSQARIRRPSRLPRAG